MSDFQNFCVYVLLLTQRIIICHVPYEFLMFEIHYMILDHPKIVIITGVRKNWAYLADFSSSAARGKNPNAMRRRSRSLALEFVKRAKRVFTNWPKCEVFWQGHDKIFCHVSKPSSISPLNLVPFGPFMPQSL